MWSRWRGPDDAESDRWRARGEQFLVIIQFERPGEQFVERKQFLELEQFVTTVELVEREFVLFFSARVDGSDRRLRHRAGIALAVERG